MAEAKRDQNKVTTLMGVSSSDSVTPVPIKVDPTTGRVLVDDSGMYDTHFITVGLTGSGADYECNGTNDEVEINAAIDEAAALPNGGKVLVLEGDYSISAAIVPKSFVWLCGEGMFATRFQATSALNSGIVDNKHIYDTASPYTSGILSDFELDGTNMDRSKELKGLNSDSLNNCKIFRIYAHHTTATGIGPDDFYGTTLAECIAYRCGYQNEKTITAATWAAGVIMFTTSTAHGYSVSDQIIVTGMIPAEYNGKYTISTTPTTTTFTVTSTFLDLDPGTATTFGLSSDALIGHNGIGIASGSNTEEANIVTNNVCIENQNNNLLIEADDSVTGLNASYIFSNNISIRAGQTGFLNTGTLNTQFLNNFDYGSINGFLASTVVRNRTVSAASWSGGTATYTTTIDHLFVIGDRIDIANMTPAGYNGFYYVTAVPTSTTFDVAMAVDPGVAIVFGTAVGIAHSVDETLISNNIASHNVDYGIRIFPRSERVKVTNNSVKNCSNVGMAISSAKSEIIGNTIEESGRSGLKMITGSGTYIALTKLIVTNNAIMNNGTRTTGDGIEMQAATNSPISDFIIANNQMYDDQATPSQRYGILIRSGNTIENIMIRHNVIKDNVTGQILIQHTDTSITAIDNLGVADSTPRVVLNLTTTERNALTAVNGMIIYNTTDSKLQAYEAGAWANII